MFFEDLLYYIILYLGPYNFHIVMNVMKICKFLMNKSEVGLYNKSNWNMKSVNIKVQKDCV